MLAVIEQCQLGYMTDAQASVILEGMLINSVLNEATIEYAAGSDMIFRVHIPGKISSFLFFKMPSYAERHFTSETAWDVQ